MCVCARLPLSEKWGDTPGQQLSFTLTARSHTRSQTDHIQMLQSQPQEASSHNSYICTSSDALRHD